VLLFISSFNRNEINCSSAVTHNENNQDKVIGSVGDDGLVVLSQPNGSVIQTLSTSPATKELTSVAFSSNSKHICTAGADGIIRLWDLKKAEISRLFKVTTQYCVNNNPQRTKYANMGEKKGHKGGATCVKWSSSEQHVASGSESGEVLLHSIATGQAVANLVPQQRRGTERAAITSLSFSPFRKSILATTSDDGSVCVWDIHARSILVQFSSTSSSGSSARSKTQGNVATAFHCAPATDALFSHVDSHLLLSVGLDKRILLFDTLTKR